MNITEVLSRELFTKIDERLLGQFQAARIGRTKKRYHFICVSVKSNNVVSLCEVKKDKEGYKKRSEWMLDELSKIAGNSSDEVHFTFENKIYKFQAATVRERDEFVEQLYTIIKRYHKNKEIGIPIENLEHVLKTVIEQELLTQTLKEENTHHHQGGDHGQTGTQRSVDQQQNHHDPLATSLDQLSQHTAAETIKSSASSSTNKYQEVTDAEENAISVVMKNFDDAVSNAEEVMTKLQNDLNNLDTKNIQTMVNSEKKIQELMHYVEHALREVDMVESQLELYDVALSSIESQMSQMKNQESFINVSNENSSVLYNDLGRLVQSLDITQTDIDALKIADLTSNEGVESCIQASNKLMKVRTIKEKVPEGLGKLKAVTQQERLFNDLQSTFSERLVHHIKTETERARQPRNLSGDMSNYLEISLPNHKAIQSRLLARQHLVLWLQKAEPNKYRQSLDKYVEIMSNRYKVEIHELIFNVVELFQTEVREDAAKEKEKIKASRQTLGSKIGGSLSKLTGSNQSLSRSESMRKVISGSTTSLKKGASKIGGSITNIAKATGKLVKGKKSSKNNDDIYGSQELDTKVPYHLQDYYWEKRRSWGQTVRKVLDEVAPICYAEETFIKKFFNVEDEKILRQAMDGLFADLLEELKYMMKSTDENDPLNSLAIMVIFSERVLSATEEKNHGSYLIKILGYCLVEAKRAFDTLCKDTVKRWESFRIKPNKRYAILPFVTEYEQFLEMSEEIWSAADNVRRTELERAYDMLTRTLYDQIERTASHSDKTPEAVLCFENFNKLHSLISRLKIKSLQNSKKLCKEKYLHYMDLYISEFMGKPLVKLSNFFDGVEELMQQGLQEEDVKYNTRFREQELKAICKVETAKTVKKGLTVLYEKVEKHESPFEHRLLEVIWTKMQDEFLKQYTYFQSLINRCYWPGMRNNSIFCLFVHLHIYLRIILFIKTRNIRTIKGL